MIDIELTGVTHPVAGNVRVGMIMADVLTFFPWCVLYPAVSTHACAWRPCTAARPRGGCNNRYGCRCCDV